MTYMLVRSSFSYHLTECHRSHTGKTKDNKTFEKFLGPKEYDDHILRPFERFLHESFSKYSYCNLVTEVWTHIINSEGRLRFTRPFEE
jgi:hypothetical protein